LKYDTYEQFLDFCLQQHSDPRIRILQAIGTTPSVEVVLGLGKPDL